MVWTVPLQRAPFKDWRWWGCLPLVCRMRYPRSTGRFLQARLSSDLLLFDGGLMYTEKSGLPVDVAWIRRLASSALCATGGDREFNQLVRYERDARKFGISAEIASPTMMLYGIFIHKTKSEIGVDLRESIVANFKPGVVSVVSMPEATLTLRSRSRSRFF